MSGMHHKSAMPDIQLSRLEEVGIVQEQRKGLVLMTVGRVLLWMDFILLAFVYVGLRSGSRMWLWWVLGEGLLGMIFLEIGAHKRGSITR